MTDTRPKKHGWAPGNYSGACSYCGTQFIGDKRAHMCADCAYEDGIMDELLPENNVAELRETTRNSWIKQLDELGVDPLIIVAGNEEGEMIVLNKLENVMEAIGFLEAAKTQLIFGEDVE